MARDDRSNSEAVLYERVLENRDDLILLDEAKVNSAGIAAELGARSRRGEMYTSIGDTLIAVNPYTTLTKGGRSIYDERVALHYQEAVLHAQAPHIFGVGAEAYNACSHRATAVRDAARSQA